MTTRYFFALLSALLLTACGRETEVSVIENEAADTSSSGEAGGLEVMTTNYPLKFFAGEIAGDHATVTLPAPSGIDPAFWEPTSEDVLKLQGADLIFTNGATYEKWLGTVTLPSEKIVVTSAEFAEDYIVIEDAVTHSHGDDGEHSHAGTAFTTWLNFALAQKQADAIAEALSARVAAAGGQISENVTALKDDLASLDFQMEQAALMLDGKPLLASHPIYQYLARGYNLDLESLHWEPDAHPDAAQWEAFDEMLEERPAKIMLWEGEPQPETRQALEERGIVVAVFEPAMNVPEEGDFMEVMSANIANLKAAAGKLN